MLDVYDEAIEYLRKHPEQISQAWGHASDHQAGVLFAFVSESRYGQWFGDLDCGCLTMVAGQRGDYHAFGADGRPDGALTDRIRNDVRIPTCASEITVESLPVFAEWQRELDSYYGRAAPRGRFAT